MSSRENLEKEFKKFADQVFPGAGEAQLHDLHTTYFAGVFQGTNEVARNGWNKSLDDALMEVHTAAFDVLYERAREADIQIGEKPQ